MPSLPDRVLRRTRLGLATGGLLLSASVITLAAALDDVPDAGKAETTPASKGEQRKLGVEINDPRAFQGFTLIAPLNSTKSYLIDMQGRVVRTWESKYTAGQEAYLLENGHLLRGARINPREQKFAGAGQGGRVQEFDWDGNLVWDYKFHDDHRISHHDICRLPSGNVLLIVWEIKTAAESLASGRKPDSARGPWLVDSLVEVKPTGKTTGEVVWEWHAWDHLIQDVDPSKANYGEVGKHPELIDVNFGESEFGFPGAPPGAGGPPGGAPPGQTASRKEAGKGGEAAKKRDMDRLKSIGYVGDPKARGNLGFVPDWTHVNAVAYNAELDQIMISVRSFGEFWILDHGTTTTEAKGHSGGKRGKGGDLLYRWGNSAAYRAGTKADQRLFGQHDAHWISTGYPGGGHVIIFNNGAGRPDGNYSSVDEVALPVDSQGNYSREPGKPFGPRDPAWTYTAPKKEDLFGFIMSGANRLPNGNTLVCESVSGTVIEVTPEGKTVWKYVNPEGGSFPGMPGGPGSGGPPKLADVLPPIYQFVLNLTPEQTTRLEATQKEVIGKLEAILDAAQRKQLLERRAADPMGFAGMGTPGQIMPLATQIVLKLSASQKQAVATVQKDVDGKIEALLDDAQKDQFTQMRDMAARGGPPGSRPGGAPPGPGGPGGPRGAGGPPMGPPGGFGNSVFRAYRYTKDYPALAGKDLTPGKTIEQQVRDREQKTAR